MSEKDTLTCMAGVMNARAEANNVNVKEQAMNDMMEWQRAVTPAMWGHVEYIYGTCLMPMDDKVCLNFPFSQFLQIYLK